MNTLKLFLTLSLLVSGGMESAQACKVRRRRVLGEHRTSFAKWFFNRLTRELSLRLF